MESIQHMRFGHLRKLARMNTEKIHTHTTDTFLKSFLSLYVKGVEEEWGGERALRFAEDLGTVGP